MHAPPLRLPPAPKARMNAKLTYVIKRYMPLISKTSIIYPFGLLSDFEDALASASPVRRSFARGHRPETGGAFLWHWINGSARVSTGGTRLNT